MKTLNKLSAVLDCYNDILAWAWNNLSEEAQAEIEEFAKGKIESLKMELEK